MSTHRKVVGKAKRYEPRVIVSHRDRPILDAEWQNASEDGDMLNYATYEEALRSGIAYLDEQHADHFDSAEVLKWLYIAEVTTKALLPSKDEIDKILKETSV